MPAKRSIGREHDIPVPSPFKTADKLLKEDMGKTGNQKRFEQWMDLMVRERKLDPRWKSDEDIRATVDWIMNRTNTTPVSAKTRSPKNHGLR